MGNLVSSIGTTFYDFAIGWFILELTGSALQAGIYIATGGIIRLILTPFCGVLADRFNKVRILYITDWIRGLTIIGAGLAIFSGLNDPTTILVLYICTIILAVNGALFTPAVSSLQMEVVDRENFQSVNATMSMIGSFQGILGILLGGILYTTLGVKWIFIINGLSFIFSGISEMFIKHPHRRTNEELSVKEGLRDFKEGLKYLISKRGLMALMIGSLLLNFAFEPLFVNGFPYLFNQILKTSALQYSYVQVAAAVGSLVGAVVIGNLAKQIKVRPAITWGLTTITLVFIMIAVSFNLIIEGSISYQLFFWIVIGLMFLNGVLLMYLNIPTNTAFAKTIEPEYRGRAFSVLGTMSMAAIPLSVFLGGFVIEVLGLQVLLILSVVILVLITTYIFSNKRITEFIEDVDK